MGNIVYDTTIFTVKPKSTDRHQREMATYELLEKLGIEYLRLDHR